MTPAHPQTPSRRQCHPLVFSSSNITMPSFSTPPFDPLGSYNTPQGSPGYNPISDPIISATWPSSAIVLVPATLSTASPMSSIQSEHTMRFHEDPYHPNTDKMESAKLVI